MCRTYIKHPVFQGVEGIPGIKDGALHGWCTYASMEIAISWLNQDIRDWSEVFGDIKPTVGVYFV